MRPVVAKPARKVREKFIIFTYDFTEKTAEDAEIAEIYQRKILPILRQAQDRPAQSAAFFGRLPYIPPKYPYYSSRY